MCIVLALEADEGPNTQDKALRAMVMSDRLFEDWMATYHPPRITGRSPFAVKHASIAFTFEARECPNTQDKAGRPVAAIGHYHEDIMANSRPPGIAEEVNCTSSVSQSAFRQLRMKHTLSCFQITRRTRLCIKKLLKILAALLRQKTRAYCVDDGRPRGSEQSRASHCGDWPPPRGHDSTCHSTSIPERRLAIHPAFQQLWKEYGVTITDATSAVWSRQSVMLTHHCIRSSVTFETQSLTEEKRSWSIWQPPMLPLWNFNTVPRLMHVAPHCKVLLAVANLPLEECGDFRPTGSSTSSAPILSSH